jgi:alpha-methylacyl-CoA racemase
VLTLGEAPAHAHNRARKAFVNVGGHLQAAPAPRFSRCPAVPPKPGVPPGTHSYEVLQAAGFADEEIQVLIDKRAIVAKDSPWLTSQAPA